MKFILNLLLQRRKMSFNDFINDNKIKTLNDLQNYCKIHNIDYSKCDLSIFDNKIDENLLIEEKPIDNIERLQIINDIKILSSSIENKIDNFYKKEKKKKDKKEKVIITNEES